ncbi:L,D-transpeptidase [Amaricoccus sp.]|uniref:L,D-transpeptidase n=1 Tax=Amaricoccus sp. TaxID=1872485 RepID=UPI001B7BE7CD|nr:L,D-transpeptidase [Amaricoccus sp.]MBP7000617.1 L,D-transpeptidase [Amaricoccus sp.]
MSKPFSMDRRGFVLLAGGAAAGAAFGGPALAQEGVFTDTIVVDPLHQYVPDSADKPKLQRRVSGSVSRNWQDYFSSINNSAILADTNDRVLHLWAPDGFYRIYPTSVPMTGDMTRRGRTTVVLKRHDPEWRPTEGMISRNPDLPRYVGPGPDNPLGVRALNLGFPGAYRIHGTNDIRKIGRQSSNGCIGLFNEHILEVYDRVDVGTPVLLI